MFDFWQHLLLSYSIQSLKQRLKMDQANLESATQRNNATDHALQKTNKQTNTDTNMVVLQGITASLAQIAKAAETKTEMLASLKEDILLRTDSDEDEEPAPGTND